MTLDEFRQRWTSTASWPEQTVTAVPEGQRLTFLPPKDTALAPRMVFREGFSAPIADPRPRSRSTPWLRRAGLVVGALAVTAGLAVGLEKFFEYVPTYINTYLTPSG